LRCDVEREKLLKEQAQIQEMAEKGLENPAEKEENTKRLTEIFARLQHIYADKAESKAI
jgi:hypothetical protein